MSFSRNVNDSQKRSALSGAANGQPLSLGSSNSVITVHTTLSSSSVFDEIWIYGSNTGSTNAVVTVSWYGTTSIKLTLPAATGLTLISPGLLLSGTGSATSSVTARDTSSTGNVYLFGYVIRTTT